MKARTRNETDCPEKNKQTNKWWDEREGGMNNAKGVEVQHLINTDPSGRCD
jgi:hypothetical protein